MLVGFQDTDRELFILINGLANKFPVLDSFMVVISSHALWLVVLLTCLARAALHRDRRQLAILAVVVAAVCVADPFSAYVLKPWFGRLRPCHALTLVQLVSGSCGGLFGFPSNHAVNAGVVVAVVGWLWKGDHRLPLLALVTVAGLAVSVSRIWLGVHYPADVCAGLIVGGATGSLVSWLALRLDRRRQASSGKNSFFD
ncbi:MAG: hypothetical protein RIQ81_2361 [Pseudomonadota bacterium]|jgi:undecaprenyl-diphosphatase